MKKTNYLIMNILLYVTPLHSMHYIRTISKHIPPTIAATFSTLYAFAGYNDYCNIHEAKPVSPKVKNIVHNIFMRHGISPAKAYKIKIRDCEKSSDLNAAAVTTIFGDKYLFVPDDLNDSPIWESILLHEYSHIKNNDSLYSITLCCLTCLWIARGWTVTIPFKLAGGIIAEISNNKYSEYQADHYSIQQCSANALDAIASDYYQTMLQEKEALNYYLNETELTRYENNVLYREYVTIKFGQLTHPSTLTRYKYFSNAAKAKQQVF